MCVNICNLFISMKERVAQSERMNDSQSNKKIHVYVHIKSPMSFAL